MNPYRHLVCKGRRVLLPDEISLKPAIIRIDLETGKIDKIVRDQLDYDPTDINSHTLRIDAGDKLVLPGLVDAHVHLNEPGRTEWEGIWTGTCAAASGGVTTVVDMPLNSIPPTTTAENLMTKAVAAVFECHVDVAFWGGVIPGNQEHIKPLLESGVRGFKCFLIESGVKEFPFVTEDDLRTAIPKLQGTSAVLLFHAELQGDEPVELPLAAPDDSNNTLYSTFLESRPEKLEENAISLITRLQREYPDLRCHIVHLSASSALPLIRAAKKAGLKLTVETCFHYLCLSADSIPNGHPEFKCCPPIRGTRNQDLLWEGLKVGDIDCVVSDHSPCVAEMKRLVDGDIMNAWGGISSLGLGLSLLWTEGQKRGVDIFQIVDWTCKKTAELAGLEHLKGQLKVRLDGDFIIWNPDTEFTVSTDSLNFKNKVSPYIGLKLKGQVEQTYLRGALVYDRTASQPFMSKPTGQPVLPSLFSKPC